MFYEKNVFIFCTIKHLDPSDDSFHILERANNQAEWASKAYFKFMMVIATSCLILMPAASIVFCLITKDAFDVDLVYNPFKYV